MDQPYISFVVTSRNDNHGGDLLHRMQIFLSGLLDQSRRFNLASELIIVEWNPPVDRPPLIDALHWPEEPPPCNTRIITVPASIHSTYPYSGKLPLFQMIAKNIGIRRANGRFIVATNIDLLFSDELIMFLASGKLDENKMYRIDRYDAEAAIPSNKSIQKQLDYCQTHVIRINTREGTYTSDKYFLKWRKELWIKISGFLHRKFPGFFKIVQGNLDSIIRIKKIIRIKLSTIFSWIRVWFPFQFSFRDFLDGRKWQIFFLNRFRLLTIATKQIFGSKNNNIHLEPPGNMLWENYWMSSVPDPRTREPITGESVVEKHSDLSIAKNEIASGNTVGTRASLKRPYVVLHTNGCGDFTLLSKEKWFQLRGYPESPIFSFNIDSLFCYNAYFGGVDEIVLRDPLRMYIIEHDSGWTPEQDKKLKKRMESLGIPMMDYRECMNWAEKMFERQQALSFNKENWGLIDKELAEIRPYE